MAALTVHPQHDHQPRAPRNAARWLSCAALFAVTFAIGCDTGKQIRSYPAPKEAQPSVVTNQAPAAEPTDRMLAAIYPLQSNAWFFKAAGPIAVIDEREQELIKFFTSIRPGDGQRPKWELPTGWKEEQGTGIRAATIYVPTDDKPLEITVNTLPWSGSPADLLSNVNRWRGQMQLPNATAAALPDCTREISAGDVKVMLVDLRGHFKPSGMSPPFAAGGPFSGNAPAGPSQRAAPPNAGSPPELPPGHPPVGPNSDLSRGTAQTGAPPAVEQTSDAPKLDAPDSWQPAPLEGIRKAAYRVVDGAKQATVTVIDFRASSGPMIADPLQNVNRWRREVGLEEVTKDGLKDATEAIEVAGQPATFVAAIPAAAQSQADRGTLAAMVPQGERIWFFKITGDRDLVEAQRDNFLTFVKSARFDAGSGASDGHK